MNRFMLSLFGREIFSLCLLEDGPKVAKGISCVTCLCVYGLSASITLLTGLEKRVNI